jgi:hypothetical protein
MALRYGSGWVRAFTLALALLPLPSAAQDDAPLERKQATAVRIPGGSIDLDGRLDEEVWNTAPALTDFVQKEPVEGAVPEDRIEVHLLYDGGGLFVGARMSSPSRSAIQAPLSRRDDIEQSEHLLVSLDTYLNRRTAYCFGVTASGVRLDHFHPSDNEDNQDTEFDPVWEAATQITEAGWTAELWIPYSQLRFNALPEQVWGLNIKRSIPSLNEENYWALVPRTVQGWSSRFGDLHGISDTPPSRRIELLPSLGGGSVVNGDRDPADPFDDGKNLDRHIGFDFKMGLGPSLTLESTVNPDFGQVEADPAEVNLSSFETFFSERRPFFLENSRLLASRVVNNFFYSRRIGSAPEGPASGDYVDYPRANTILGAAKLSGRLPSGLSMGFLGAVTDDEHAQTFDIDTSVTETIRVAPQTAFGVARLEQEFGANASTASFMLTGVHRDVAPEDPLAARLARDAFSVYSDAVLRFKGGEYELSPYAGFSRVDGEAAAIDRLQRSSRRYLHRPDADYIAYDPTREYLAGFKGGAQFERVSGRHWLGQVSLDIESPEFEVNDVGRLTAGDAYVVGTNLRYRETQPGDLLRAYSIGVSTRTEWNFGWDLQTRGPQGDLGGLDVQLTWPNFWRTDFSFNYNPRAQDERLTRGGPSMGTPQDWNVVGEVRNSSQARNTWSGRLQYAEDEDGGWYYDVSGSFSFRPAPRWELSFEPGYVRESFPQQYVDTIARTGPETYGQRYIFSFIDRTTIVTQFRLNFTFKPDLTLEVYAEPFAASGDFYRHGELRTPRTRDMLRYGEDGTVVENLPDGSLRVHDGPDTFILGNEDFNVLSFRSNVVLRWEWRPGSTLFVVWQQDRLSEEMTDEQVSGGDLFQSFTAPGTNFFVVKASFWIPIN